MKVAVCTNFISPYRRPVFRALAQRTGADVRVFVSTTMESDRDWAVQGDRGEPYTVERVAGVRRAWTKRTDGPCGFRQRLDRHFPLGLPGALRRYGPDVVISGELGPRTIAAKAYGAMTGTPVIPWAYPPRAQASNTGPTASVQRFMLRRSPCIVGMGSQARATLRDLGARDDSIVDAPNSADTQTIAARLGSAEHRAEVRRIRVEQDGRHIAAVVGRLVPMKGIETLVDAWNGLDASIKQTWRLVFVGDGVLRSYIESNRVDDSIHITGHVDPSEVPDWFAAADLHVFASLGDPWGLVVNEAMQCGTPTLCSSLAGCCDDLIRHAANGLRFTPSPRRDHMAAELRAALTRPDLDQLGAAARDDIAGCTPERMAECMASAIERVRDTPGTNPRRISA
ncbi:MAG: glycosyltransferase family 4 protein [Planctomycetota bacterium]